MESIHKTVYERFRRACPDLICSLYDPGQNLILSTHPSAPKHDVFPDPITFSENGTFSAYVVLSDGWFIRFSGSGKSRSDVEHLFQLVLSIQRLILKNQRLNAEISGDQDKMSLLLNRLFSMNTSDDIAYTAISAVSMGYDMTLPRIICLFKLQSTQDGGGLQESTLQSITGIIKNHGKIGPQDLIGRVNSNQIVLCKTIPSTLSSVHQHCQPILSSICASLMELYPISVQVGIGEVCYSFSDYSTSFLEITQVLRCQELLGVKRAFNYTSDNQLELEILRLPLSQTAHFLNEKLSILERSPQFLETIEALLLYNMNIRDAAEHLFVHHNTVVFRINRIKELLSLDPLQKNSDLAMLTMLYMYAKLKPIMFPSSRGYDAYRSETQPSKEAIK